MHTIEIVALILEEPVNQSVKVWLQQCFVMINFSACITSKPNIFFVQNKSSSYDEWFRYLYE